MNCIFCKQQLEDGVKSWVAPISGPEEKVSIELECVKCKTTFHIMEKDEELTSYVMISGFYRVLVLPAGILIGYNETDSTYNIHTCLFQFATITHNITPSNIDNKIKTILTFS